MSQYLFFNAAHTTVSSGGTTAPSAGSSESWTVASSALFTDGNSHTATTDRYQFAVVDPADTSSPPEVMLVTNVSGTTWTVTRGAEGTTPVAHAAGFTVKAVHTAGADARQRQFWVDDFGAKGDGSTNDTAAIQAALDACDLAGGGTVLFTAGKTYVLSSAPRTDRGGYAILALKQYATSGASGPSIVIEGNNAGLKCTNTGLTHSASFGSPSVFGGPTAQNANAFTQIDLEIRNLGLTLPANPTISGFDLFYVTRAVLKHVFVSTTSVTTQPTNIWTFGFRMPTTSNFGLSLCNGGAFGQYVGLVANTEHTRVEDWFNKWCFIGYAPHGDSGFHGSTVQMLKSEWCTHHLAHWDESTGLSTGDGSCWLNIEMLDIEDAAAGSWFSTTDHVRDASGYFRGVCRFIVSSISTGYTANGLVLGGSAPNLKLLDIGMLGINRPPNTVPTVPTSGTAFGLYYMDTVWYFSGGTVSSITVGGITTGVTSGPVVVPSGKAIIVNYTSVPTLNAVLAL